MEDGAFRVCAHRLAGVPTSVSAARCALGEPDPLSFGDGSSANGTGIDPQNAGFAHAEMEARVQSVLSLDAVAYAAVKIGARFLFTRTTGAVGGDRPSRRTRARYGRTYPGRLRTPYSWRPWKFGIFSLRDCPSELVDAPVGSYLGFAQQARHDQIGDAHTRWSNETFVG